MDALEIREGLVLPGTLFSFAAVRASGPGGQNVNKVSSKVEVRFDLDACEVLAPDVKDRLRAACRNRLDAEGRVLLTCDVTRDQRRNLEIVRERLRSLVLAALVPPTIRKATKPSRAAKRRRVADKRHHAARKKERASGPGSDD